MLKKVLVHFLVILSLTFPSMASAAVPEWIRELSRGEKVEVTDEQSEITCLALVVYYEARGEAIRGQRTVAEVVMNRTRSPKYPSTVCQVMFQHRQFSFVRRDRVLTPRQDSAWMKAKAIAEEVFYSPKTDTPWLSFCNCSKSGFRIGNHVFYGR